MERGTAKNARDERAARREVAMLSYGVVWISASKQLVMRYEVKFAMPRRIQDVIASCLVTTTSSLRSAIEVHYSYNSAPVHIKSFLTFPKTVR